MKEARTQGLNFIVKLGCFNMNDVCMLLVLSRWRCGCWLGTDRGLREARGPRSMSTSHPAKGTSELKRHTLVFKKTIVVAESTSSTYLSIILTRSLLHTRINLQ